MRVAWVTQSDIVPIRLLLGELNKHIETRMFNVEGGKIRGFHIPNKKTLWHRLDSYHPDIIVCDEPYQGASSICRKYCEYHSHKIALILTVRRNNTSGIVEKLFFKMVTPVMQTNIAGADKVVSISSRGAEWITGYCPNIGEKIKVIPNGVDLENFETDYYHFKITNYLIKKRIILNVSRNHPDKRLDLSIEIFNKLKKKHDDLSLVLIGGGPEIESHEGVKQLEGIKYSKMKFAYHDSEVVILTSSREPFGMSLIEAMACSKPVVAFDIGGTNDIIEQGKNGYLIPYGDTAQFASAVNQILSDQPLRHKMGLYGRKLVEKKFQIQDVAHQWLKVFKEVSE